MPTGSSGEGSPMWCVGRRRGSPEKRRGSTAWDSLVSSSLLLRFQNENLVAIRDGDMVASVPDLIVVVSSDMCEPITTEELRYGFRVTVLAAPCDARWRTPKGLELVDPRYLATTSTMFLSKRPRVHRSKARAPACSGVQLACRRPLDRPVVDDPYQVLSSGQTTAHVMLATAAPTAMLNPNRA